MKKVTQKILSLLFISLVAFSTGLYAQDEEEKEKEKDKRPVRAPFESSIILDNQTVIVPGQGTMQFEIQHRFGTLENGISDFFGMWAPSNIRLGMGYVPKENIMLGIGATKFKQFVDINYKWNFLKQTRSWSIPVGLTWFGYVGIDTRGQEILDNKPEWRLSYFNELIIASRINNKLSLQVMPSFTHYNAVDSLYSNDIFAISAAGRYKISSQTSIIAEGDQPITRHDALTTNDDGLNYRLPLPNISLGFEISTSTHAFQIFVANYQAILYGENIAFNSNDIRNGEILLGFNITRLWNW
ncbi:MAG: hypothetical protein HKN67_09590 [Saprospiraceae bacterium]|nr:hypothetical protein [Saprospiraceae bacterium]